MSAKLSFAIPMALVCCFASAVVVAPASAQYITGVAIENFSSELPGTVQPCCNRRASYLLGSTGLNINGPGTHSTAPDGGTMWLSDQNPNIAAQFVTFDLGATYDLAATHIWNYNEVNILTRGVYQMRILVSPDNVSYRDLGIFTLNKAPDPASAHRDFSQRIPLNVSNVRYVQFDVLSSWGDTIHVGLSKVRFEAAPAETAPVPAGLVLHLDAGDVDANGTPANEPGSGTTVSTWFDKSGQSNHGVASGNPTLVRDGVNGRPVIRFDGGDLYSLPSFAGLSAGEIFAVVRANHYPAQVPQTSGLWDFGTASAQTHYSWVNSLMYDSFGTTVRNDVINTTVPLDQWNIYSVLSAPNLWVNWLNGIEQRNRASNTVSFSASPTIGRSFSGTYMFGEIAEVVMYNRGLNVIERQQVLDYLQRKYNLSENYNDSEDAPPHTEGLTIHLDASTVTGFGSGGTVPVWEDRSGSAFRASLAAGDPVLVKGALGGSAAVRFNGNDEYTLGNRSGAFPSGATVFVSTSFNDAGYNLFSTLNNDPWWRWPGNGLSYMGLFRNPRNEGFVAMPTAGQFIYTVESTPAFWQLYQDASAIGSVGPSYNVGNDYRVGGGYGVPDKFLSGDIGEVLVYDRALSAEKRADIGAYLNAKYKIASRFSSLPVLNGRVLHLAADAIPNAVEGQVLTNWIDMAQGLTATAAGDPTYHLNKVNGKPVVRFDGVGDTFSVPLSTNEDMSIFVVTKGTNYQSMIRWQPGSWIVYPWGNGNLIQTQNGGTPESGSINAGLVPNEWNLAGAIIDTGAANGVRTYRNGVLKGQKTYSAAWGPLSPLWISSINGGGEFLSGDIAEIIIYHRALSDVERWEVERYLNEKYGLEGKGPGGNYKANLELWMRADKGVNVDTSGAVLDWEDQSGFNVYAYQDVAANRPTLAVNSQNNLPAVRFSNPAQDLATADYFKTNGVWPGGREASIMIAALGTSDVPATSAGYQSIVRYQGGGWLIYPWYNSMIINPDSSTNGVATGLVMNQWNIGGGFYRAATTNGFQTYRDGTLVGQKNSADITLLQEPLLLGACCGATAINGESPNGDVGEIVVYSERLNEAKRVLAENYLSARFNRSLSGLDVYAGDSPGNGNFDFAMAGIGRLGNPIDFGDGTNPFGAGVNPVSNSEGFILADAGFLNESGDFMVAAHNGWYNEATNEDLAGSGAQNRWTRVWYLDKTDPSNNGGQVLLRFDFSDSDFSGTRSGSHVLLRRPGNGGTFSVAATAPQVFDDSYTFTLNAAGLSDGYYTLAETDSIAPTITLTGGDFTMECGNAYVEPGYTATDNSEGNMTGDVVVTGSVNVNQTGIYILRYDVSDTAGNDATQRQRTVTVVDTTAPVISLNGLPTVNIECGTAYVDQGATALDDCNGNLTSSINVSGATIDASVTGQHFVTYTVSDIAGNPAIPVQRTVNVVDTLPPVLTVNGGNMTLECGVDTFTDPGASAADTCAGTVPVTVGGDTVNVGNPNVYTITYNATDGTNAAPQQTRTVTVQDTVGPVITLNGSQTDSVALNQPYVDPGATATDACQGAVAVNVTGLPVNTSTLGPKTITYSAVDGFGNPTQVNRTVNVVPGNPPVITRLGDAVVTVECGGSYTDAGATASDTEDGNLTGSISVGGLPIDTATPGSYVITYDVTDSSGNDAGQVTRTVNVVDSVAPTLSLIGSANPTVQCGGTYSDAGATASDTCDDNAAVTANIVVTGLPINTAQKGPKTITYNVMDSEGNAAAPITRTVTVVDTTPPVISRNGASFIQVSCGGTYNDQGATATDSCDDNAAVTAGIAVTGLPIDTGTPAQYFVRYNVSDLAGNAATEVVRTVEVVDNVPPVLNLIGGARVEIVVGGAYAELGASATDACEGDLPVAVGGDVVDTSSIGSYFVTYDAVDSSGNPAVQVIREVVVTVGVAPFIDGQPSDQFVTFGEDAVFEVSAVALAAIAYEWQRDGVPLANDADYQGVDTPTLTVLGAANADEGAYRCRVTSGGASVFSINAALVVQDPGILTQPESKVVQPGATVQFSVVAAGSGTLTYQWQKDGTPLSNGGNVSGATSATLSLGNVQEGADEAAYRCVVTGGGDPPVTSAAATLTVGNPAIVTSPPDQRVPRGATVEFEIQAVGAPPLLYRWRKDGQPMTNGGRISGVDSPQLVITNAQENDEAVYVCRVVGQNTVESVGASLIVDGPPVISGINVLPASGIVPKEGPAALTVLVSDGAEPFSFEWQKDGVPLVDDGRIAGVDGPTLTIASAEVDDAGVYRCIVSNAVDEVTSPSRSLQVGLTFVQNLTDRTAENGDRFVWSVRVEGGFGQVQFQWVLDDGTKVFQPVSNGSGISGATSDTLVFDPVTFADAGTYRVDIVDNTDAASSDEATLTVVEALGVVDGVLWLVALAVVLALAGVRLRGKRAAGGW